MGPVLIRFLHFLLLAGLPVGIEVLAEGFPALVVALVQSLACLQAPLCHSHTEGRLKHEGLNVNRETDIGAFAFSFFHVQ